jgi:hypothetical protein
VIASARRPNGAFLVDVDVGVVGPDGVDGGHAWDHEAEGDFDYARVCQKGYVVCSLEIVTLQH